MTWKFSGETNNLIHKFSLTFSLFPFIFQKDVSLFRKIGSGSLSKIAIDFDAQQARLRRMLEEQEGESLFDEDEEENLF